MYNSNIKVLDLTCSMSLHGLLPLWHVSLWNSEYTWLS